MPGLGLNTGNAYNEKTGKAPAHIECNQVRKAAINGSIATLPK